MKKQLAEIEKAAMELLPLLDAIQDDDTYFMDSLEEEDAMINKLREALGEPARRREPRPGYTRQALCSGRVISEGLYEKEKS